MCAWILKNIDELLFTLGPLLFIIIFLKLHPQPENSYFCFPVLKRPALSFIFLFETNWFLLGSPIWKPRDQGQDWEGSGSETGSEVRGRPPRSSSTNQRPSLDLSTNQRSGDSGSDQRKTVGFESSPQSNGKKETLQSACKRKWNVTSFL